MFAIDFFYEEECNGIKIENEERANMVLRRMFFYLYFSK